MKKLGIALAALALFSTGEGTAYGTHPRPKGATPISVSLVPWFGSCTAPDRTHGAPLAFPSCAPPNPPRDTVPGTPEVNGAGANQEGRVRYDVIVGVPGPPDDSDVRTSLSVTDVRCVGPNGGPCPSSNSPGPPDYPGEVQFNVDSRVTDHYNSPSGTAPGTLQDIPFPVNGQCAITPDTSIGATCSVATTFNAVVPGTIKDGKRTTWQMGEVVVFDGDGDQKMSTADNFPFAVQGVFIP